MLKGSGLLTLWPDVWPILAFATGAIALGLAVYRKTLD
jgi:hypothetical protein